MGGAGDQRDNRTWVVLELTRAGEQKVEEGVFPSLLRESLGVDANFPVFVPSVSYMQGGRRTTVHLMEGYAFVSSGLPEVTYLNLEGNNLYVRKVLSSKSPSGMRVLSVIPDTAVQDMRAQLAQHVSSDLVEGMRVTVTDGVYANLQGEVLVVEENNASVRFVLRSLDIITTIPRVFLTPDDGEEGG